MLTYSGDRIEANAEELELDNCDESVDGTDCYSDEDDESHRQPVVDHRSIYGNKHGWYFIGGVVGEGHDTAVATEDAMKKLISR